MTDSARGDRIRRTHALARDRAFTMSCDDDVGRVLDLEAQRSPPSATIVELGTGAGVGLAWIVNGLVDRADVRVLSVDSDAELLQEVRLIGWPASVQLTAGDALEELRLLGPGSVDLLFADAPAGKLHDLEDTIAALAPGGTLIMDDMRQHEAAAQRAVWPEILRAAKEVADDSRFEVIEHLPVGSGVLRARRHS